jgi:hypothetical protein
MPYTLGLDVGSGFSKAVVCEDALPVVCVAPSGRDYRGTVEKVNGEALARQALLKYIFRTVSNRLWVGHGRIFRPDATDISGHAEAFIICSFGAEVMT